MAEIRIYIVLYNPINEHKLSNQAQDISNILNQIMDFETCLRRLKHVRKCTLI